MAIPITFLLRIIKYFILFFLLILIIYYTSIIVDSRNRTRELVNSELKSPNIQLDLKDLSREQIGAIIKVQDPNFYNHHGVDMQTPGAGVTTISQSLVKVYYFKNFNPGISKIKQTLISYFAFDPLTPKDTILKLFINQVYLGEENGKSINGLQNGAKSYFHKQFAQLDWEEFLSLVAMFRAPNLYNVRSKSQANFEGL
jgi:membrane peptidoglycan carboxypeptidase